MAPITGTISPIKNNDSKEKKMMRQLNANCALFFFLKKKQMKKAAIVIRCVSIKEIIINGLDKSVIDGLKNELNSADGIDLINSKNELFIG
jgi:hypothetical protein